MKHFTFNYLHNYKNHGQDAEQSVRYTLTGELVKADNLPFDKGADCLNYQIKSARATVCKGTDLQAYLKRDASTAYIYATKDGIAYIMNRVQYADFVEKFGTVTRESKSNGGAEKIRLKAESKEMLEYLSRH